MSQPNILHNFKSKNFDSRKYKIQFIVLHYTETKNLEKAIDLLTSQKRKVSCHFVVDTNGQIYNLVSESKRAWHAGESSWKGLQDMNRIQQSTAVLLVVQSTNRNPSSTCSTSTTSTGSSTKY